MSKRPAKRARTKLAARGAPRSAARAAAPPRSTRPARSRRPRVPVAKRPRIRPTPELADEIYRRLERAYPDAHCALNHRDAYQLLVATILSAQCTDARVNMVTPALFAHYPNARALADAEQGSLEQEIKSTGFFRNKAKSLLGMARAVAERHHGEIPRTMEELVQLPGVGRKTANVVLGNAFDTNVGVVVDTHVTRVSNRLGLTRENDPVKIERDLMALVPRDRWTMLAHLFIQHGRVTCVARAPRCGECPLVDLCPSARV